MSVKGLALPAERQDYLMLCRTYVSSKAAGKARPVLEGVWLNAATITACVRAYPQNDEEIVQDGLTRWADGLGRQPPTWGVLLEAMKYANIAQQYVDEKWREFRSRP